LLGIEIERYNAASDDGAPAEVSFMPCADSELQHSTLDGLAVLAMAGVAGEVLACGNAEGGTTDVAQLRQLMAKASPAITELRAQDDRIRWATLMALTYVQTHRERLDRLVDALQAGETIGNCVAAIEVSGPQSPSTDGTCELIGR
jgi:tRNA U34 5-carboxymethylaminomethyl modifying enzyme MnmG/GidA